jgi:small conductance mechanosensitive channel
MRAMLDDLREKAIAFWPTLLIIALILLVTIVVSRRTQGLVRRLSSRTQAPPELIDLLGRLGRFVVLAVGILLVLDRLNLSGPVLGFVASLGIAGIILGFALQDIVKQFAAGVLLLMLRPFRVGDDVKIGAFQGQVMEVQLRATVLKTVNGDEVLIPNADVYSTAIVNQTRYDVHRHDILLAVPPEADLERTRAAIAQALAGVPGIVAEPAPVVVATGLDGQSARVEVRFWLAEQGGIADGVKTAAVAAIRQALSASDEAKGKQGEGEIR